MKNKIQRMKFFVVRWRILMMQNSVPIEMIRKKIARTLFN